MGGRLSGSRFLPPPSTVQVGGSPLYKIGRKLGEGGFAQVFVGHCIDGLSGRSVGPDEVAVKLEQKKRKGCNDGPPNEWRVHDDLGEIDAMPKVYFTGEQGDFYVMIMDLLGPSLQDGLKTSGQTMSPQMVAHIAVESIAILERVHSKGYVHGDVKPANFLLGLPNTSLEKKLHLIDLGAATRWMDHKTGKHISYDQRPHFIRGTLPFASVHAHLGRTPSRRNDLESLAYTLVYLHDGKLSWIDYKDARMSLLMCESKLTTSSQALSIYCPSTVKIFFDIVANMKFDEEPDYKKLVSLFDSTKGMIPAAGPTNTNGTRKATFQVGQKRDSSMGGEKCDEHHQKKARLDVSANLWFSVYNGRLPMKQRVVNKVSDSRLAQFIEEGKEDGLFVNCIASYFDIWALTMEDGTGFESQICRQASEFFEKAWILKQWDKNYTITSVAARTDGSSLLVMSKGAPYGKQTYKICEAFPSNWIRKKWRTGFKVTSMATAGKQCGIVMSQNAGFGRQVVELDFVCPSESIHLHDAGYRITSAAASSIHFAYILSETCPKSPFETQETLVTNCFPSEGIEEKRAKNMYLTSLCCRKGSPQN